MTKKNDYLLTSERLGFRLCRESDFNHLVQLDTDPEVRAFFPMGVATPEQIKERMLEYKNDFAKNGYGIFILDELATGEFVGRCGFKALDTGEIEVGYLLLKKFWGMGLASEALASLLVWAENHIPVDKIIAFAPAKHLASQRVMQKCGMRYDKNAEMYGIECVFYKMKLKTPNAQQLQHAGHAATIDFYRIMSIDLLCDENMVAAATGISSPFLNVVFSTQSTIPDIDASIKKATEFFHKHNLPWSWMTSTSMPSAQLTNVLAIEGFQQIDESPALYFDLTQSIPEITCEDLQIVEIAQSGDLRDWIIPISEGFPSDDGGEPYRLLNEKLLQSGCHSLKHYAAYHQKEVVCAGTLFFSGNVVMLHNMATRTHATRRGFASALTAHLLQQAKAVGCSLCFLDASAEANQLYRKLGFEMYDSHQFYQRT